MGFAFAQPILRTGPLRTFRVRTAFGRRMPGTAFSLERCGSSGTRVESERAGKFVEQRKKERLLVRCESRQHAGVGFARRLGELRKQFLPGPCQLQAMPAAIVKAD